MGLELAHRPLTTFARSHNDEPSNRTVSSFSLINDPDKQHATLGATIHRRDSWSLSPVQHATRSAQITKTLLSLIIQRFERSGTFHLIELYYALYPVVTNERPHRPYCHIWTRLGDSGAGTPGRAGRVMLKCWGETEGMRSRDG
jgi:hypothetical protein